MLSRKMSTTIKNLDKSNNTKDLKDLAFKEWLAGLIDGDGYFLLSKNGYNSCEITMDARDKKVLYLVQLEEVLSKFQMLLLWNIN